MILKDLMANPYKYGCSISKFVVLNSNFLQCKYNIPCTNDTVGKLKHCVREHLVFDDLMHNNLNIPVYTQHIQKKSTGNGGILDGGFTCYCTVGWFFALLSHAQVLISVRD
jgi:hypothetical protein